jgi:hypothetical protein
LISGQKFYACNATYVGVVLAYGFGPVAVLHFSLHAVGIDELFRPLMHQPLKLAAASIVAFIFSLTIKLTSCRSSAASHQLHYPKGNYSVCLVCQRHQRTEHTGR